MMPELSLNILDVAENSVTAGAKLVRIGVRAETQANRLTVTIADDGCGMTTETAARIVDPFYTTRSTRKVGLGVPFFKMAAELTGGSLTIESTPQVGTTVTAVFGLRHIDRMPMGDLAGSFCTLLQPNNGVDFVLDYAVDGVSFTIDTREYRQVLDGVSLGEPEVLAFIGDAIREGIAACGAPL